MRPFPNWRRRKNLVSANMTSRPATSRLFHTLRALQHENPLVSPLAILPHCRDHRVLSRTGSSAIRFHSPHAAWPAGAAADQGCEEGGGRVICQRRRGQEHRSRFASCTHASCMLSLPTYKLTIMCSESRSGLCPSGPPCRHPGHGHFRALDPDLVQLVRGAALVLEYVRRRLSVSHGGRVSEI